MGRLGLRPGPYFYAIEPGADAARPHVHALVAATAGLTIAELKGVWVHGIPHVRVYDPRRRAAHYVVKEVGGRCELYDLSRRWPPLLAAA